jgi:phenylacetate-CoA ligase
MINWRKPVIFALFYLSGSKIPRNLKIIQKLSRSSKNNIKKYQDEKLKKILLHAYKNVPYYHRVLAESGVITKSGRINLKKFSNIPILTKDIIRREGKNLYSRDYKCRGYYKNTSGGSTGEPIVFIQDKEYSDWNDATKIYYFNSLGMDFGKPEIKLWGSDRDILQGNLTFKDRFSNWIYNRKFFNCYDFSEGKIRALIDLNNKYKPVGYWSYMEAMDELAEYIVENKIEVHKPKYIVSSIGPLAISTRKKVEKAFDCSLYDQYGSREVGIIAGEMKGEDGKKIFTWFNFIEVGPNKESRVIVTNLRNYSMPLIRYDLGDVVLGNSNSIKKIYGRTLGYFHKKNGSLVHSHFIVQALFYKDWIKRFQIIQEKSGEINIAVEIRKGQKAKIDDQKEIKEKIRKLFGKGQKVKFSYEKNIKPSKSGKYLYTICQYKKNEDKK